MINTVEDKLSYEIVLIDLHNKSYVTLKCKRHIKTNLQYVDDKVASLLMEFVRAQMFPGDQVYC